MPRSNRRGWPAWQTRIAVRCPRRCCHAWSRRNGCATRRWPGRDWILTRILWLTGLESGRNRGGKVIRDAGPMNAGTTIIAFIEDPDGYPIELIGRKG